MTIKSYFTPESLEEALSLKASHGYQLEVIAGGTLMIPQINDGHLFPEMVMGLRRANLNNVALNGKAVIGAAATMTQMERLHEFPLLQEAAHSIGGWAVRNMATVAGNLFNQPPYGDFCVALLAMGCQLKVQNSSGQRMVDLNDFLSGGRQLGPGELITELQVNKPAGMNRFRKFGRRKAYGATIVTLAVHVELVNGLVSAARVALGGADSMPRRFPSAENVLLHAPFNELSIKAAAAAAAADSNPVTDPVASAWYRRKMIEVQLNQVLNELAGISDG